MDSIEIIYRLRRAGYSQVAVAQELGVSRANVNAVIHDKNRSRRIASRIAEIIGADIHLIWPDVYTEIPLTNARKPGQ